ncbi:hypothetical protein [Roseateles amylovorans]|uniref:Uncharacterized protein n=1 Tax=Roseateles amylovorans TaxID=2978473 RepID=A0ABY6ATL4_9BURK|nr:hypothetical protein [Roseateles amylovorans]UXH76177.1 hypothetical protein N4261_13950 [Roseateles amylovorans]
MKTGDAAAFIAPTVEDFKNAPSNPFRGVDTAVTDFMKLGVGGGLTLATGGLFLRGAMAVNAEVAAWGGWLGGGARGAVMGNLVPLTELSMVGTEATLGVVTNTVAPSVVLAGVAARSSGLIDELTELRPFGNTPKVISTARSGQLAELLPVDSLTKRQLATQTELSEAGSTAIFRKRDVSMNDLVAIGKVTGDEYSMFTNKGSRLIIRGDGSDVVVSPEMYSDLLAGEYGRFSGHTHRLGYSVMPGPQDRPFLASLGQERSTIWGYDGTRYTFGQHGLADDSRIATEIAQRKWMRLYGLN